jgi:hypothetical protein
VFRNALLVGASDVAATHLVILRCADSKKSTLLIAQVNIDAAARPLAQQAVEVGGVLAAQSDHYPAQGGRGHQP